MELSFDGFGAGRLPRAVAALEAARAAGLHLGAQLYVSQGGAPVADLALGEAAPGEPLTRGHLMLWLSSTKPLTAAAVLRLWERGALGLDDRVTRFVPEFAAGGKGEITVRQLLTHTCGFRLLDDGWPECAWAETIARIAAMRLEPRWVPGEKAGYHLQSSWFVLGEIARRLDGRPFDRLVRDELFEPLGMADSWIGMPEERWAAYGSRIAEVFDTGAPGGGARPRGWAGRERTVKPAPGGNGRGPVRELGRFYEAMLAGGALDGRRVLSPQTVEAAAARHRAGMYDHTFRHVLDWGLGFIVDSKQYGEQTVPYGYGRLCSRRTFGHSGYRSSAAFADPVHGLVVALAANGTPTAEAHERRLRAALEGIYLDLGLDLGGLAAPGVVAEHPA